MSCGARLAAVLALFGALLLSGCGGGSVTAGPPSGSSAPPVDTAPPMDSAPISDPPAQEDPPPASDPDPPAENPAPTPDPWASWFDGGFGGKTVVFWGNSTVSNAVYFFDQLRAYTAAGQALEGLDSANILNYGSNGASLAAMLNGQGAYAIEAVIAAHPDLLVIRGPLINDVRLGYTSLDQAEQLLATALDRIRAGSPNTAILLTTENSLLTSDVDNHGYVQPASAAQSYTDILRAAVLAMRGRYPNVRVIDMMQLEYGTVCQATSPLMFDQLHPSDVGQRLEADLLAKLIGKPTLTDASRAQVARLQAYLGTTSPIAPYFAAQTSLAGNIDGSARTIVVSAADAFPQEVPFIAELRSGSDSEYVLVTDRSAGVAWSVVRGYDGTTPKSFVAGASVISMPVIQQKSTVVNGEPLGDTADVKLVRYPAGIYGADPRQLLSESFESVAPVYIAQAARLRHRGAVLTGDLPATNAASLSVDSTADFPQDGPFVAHVDSEDLRVHVADASTLAIDARGVNGTQPVAISDAATALHQVFDVDTRAGGTQAFLVSGGLNAGLRYLGIAPTVGPLLEYAPKQRLSLSFEFDGSAFELLASGNLAALLMVEGVIQHLPNQLVEAPYSGNYWHRFDFGSRKVRHITLLLDAYPMAIAVAPGDAIGPWDRSTEPVISWDGDSFGQTEGYVLQNTPNGGGMGFFLEAALQLGFTQIDYAAPVGGTGYTAQGAPALPTYPRPKYSGVNRVNSITNGPAPSLFIGALGHNDDGVDLTQFAADARAYWAALRKAWPDTVFVATQFYFPAAGPAVPEAFEANPKSTPRDELIRLALVNAGGPWIYVNANDGAWVNSSGASGVFATAGQPLITGTGYGGASGYRGGHTTGVGNGDTMIRDDGVHTSNAGARYLGVELAMAIQAAVQAM